MRIGIHPVSFPTGDPRELGAVVRSIARAILVGDGGEQLVPALGRDNGA